MVKDMSDQCRIIESIIAHVRCEDVRVSGFLMFSFWQHAWFFSSWDEDVNVPVDSYEDGCQPVSGMNQQLIDQAENLGESSFELKPISS
jgi:hypothetical protein